MCVNEDARFYVAKPWKDAQILKPENLQTCFNWGYSHGLWKPWLSFTAALIYIYIFKSKIAHNYMV